MTWFTLHAKSEFKEHILPRFVGKPTNYLEIGVWKGDSLVWMLEHVLTHPDSYAYAVDPWLPLLDKHDLESMDGRYKWTVDRLGNRAKKCTVVREMSSIWLRRNLLESHSLDLAYIDGEHYTPGIIDDFVLVWPLVNIGGMIVLDDYRADNPNQKNGVQTLVNSVVHPIYGQYIDVVFEGWSIGIRKTGDVLLSNKPTDDGRRLLGIQTRPWQSS